MGIKEFSGQCLIIGGGWREPSVNPPWREKKDFFTMDIDEDESPDVVMDINSEAIPAEFKDKFNFIFFEYFPFDGVTPNTFKNALDMLTKDGVILFTGEIPEDSPTYTKYLKELGFNYVAFKPVDADEDDDVPTIFIASKAADVNEEYLKSVCYPGYQYLEHYNFFVPEKYSLEKEMAFKKQIETGAEVTGSPSAHNFFEASSQVKRKKQEEDIDSAKKFKNE